jgi:hypothetical protein
LQTLKKWAPHAYFHAKNVQALAELLTLSKTLGFKCFFHDTDDYTITSDGYIWAYPGKELVTGSICVMPERASNLGMNFNILR